METYEFSTELHSIEEQFLNSIINTYDQRDYSSMDIFVDEYDLEGTGYLNREFANE
jgi:hypothetical protein